MELSDYLRVLRQYWTGVGAFILLGVAAAAIFSIEQPRTYQADASGLVSAGPSGTPGEASVADSLAKSRAASYVDLAASRATAQTVIDQLHLARTPARLITDITVTQPPDTVLIKISARARTPRAAQRIADGWIAALQGQVELVESAGRRVPNALHIVPIESAALPMAPISPKPPRNVVLGMAAGAVLGLAYAVLRSQLDRKLRRPEDIYSRFGLAVAGTIPTTASPLGQRAGATRALVVSASNQGSPASQEAYLKLRTNLQFMNIDRPPRKIVVTSPLPGDGKSTVAANLAAALALSNQEVVLVDGDLRRPAVAGTFGLPDGAGLTDVLIGRAHFTAVTQTVHTFPTLRILAAGGTPPNPSELLGSLAMRRLLDEIATTALVIIDAPPLLPVTDAAVLTAVADGALIVVSTGQTLDTQLSVALGHLNAVQGKALGVVLNRMPTPRHETGYYERAT